ncbi:MAG: hypothetical protein G01um101429_814 [Parcubacteria group bacterium Gr01-1014_29]|nr:MAG: hypothetical protein G01um101429_814 [Parcubacteria group bacterium Gr01-1014_29]
MDKLEELRKRLFRKEESFLERQSNPTLSPAPMSGPRTWGSRKDPALAEHIQHQQQKRILRYALFATIIFGVIALAVAAVVFVVLGERASVTKENIFLAVEAPKKITVGENVTFEVRFQNRNSVALESVDLIFEYPEGARPLVGEIPRGPFRERITIGRLTPNEERREVFRAFLFGKEGDVLTAKATLEYRPQNSSARFGKDSTFSVAVERSPIGIAIAMPADATGGQQIEIVIDYVSTTESLLKDVFLDILYPSGFKFTSASPVSSKDNNLWRLGDIPSRGEGSIVIIGTITGNPDELKHFDVRIGLLNEETEIWSSYGQVSKSLVIHDTLLAVDVRLSENHHIGITPGQTVNFSIIWRNNLPVSARNILMEAIISGVAVDYTHVSSSKGSYDSARHKIVWTATQEPAFRFVSPGQSGVVELQVPVLAHLPIQLIEDKNFTVTVEAKMYTNTVPEGFAGVKTEGEDSAVVKVATQFGFVSRGLQRSGVFQNTGPLPPRVGMETTYTVMWSLTSSANDAEGVSVHASVPAYVEWKNVIAPSGEQVVYDPDTREITWDAGFVVAGTGYTRPAREVSFQVGITPGVSHVGREPEILSSSKASGHDAFTGLSLQDDETNVTTRILADTKVTNNEYEVVQ